MSTATSEPKRKSAAETRDWVVVHRPTWLLGIEVACYAGVSYGRVYSALASGALPAKKIGRRFHVALAAVDGWIGEGCPEAMVLRNPQASDG